MKLVLGPCKDEMVLGHIGMVLGCMWVHWGWRKVYSMSTWGRDGVSACGINGIRPCLILDMNKNIPVSKGLQPPKAQLTYLASSFLFLRYTDFDCTHTKTHCCRCPLSLDC